MDEPTKLAVAMRQADRPVVFDDVNQPAHYRKGKFETIDIIDDTVQHYAGREAHYVGTIIGYLSRAPHKGEKAKDLRKAQWYMNRLVAGL